MREYLIFQIFYQGMFNYLDSGTNYFKIALHTLPTARAYLTFGLGFGAV